MRVALTFDAEHPDRPTVSGVEGRLLDVLDDLEVRATFFVQGRWAEAFPSTARRVAARHLVGNHSHYHCRMPLLSDQGLSADISSAESAIRRHMKVDPRPWFRCPFGAGAGDRGSSRLWNGADTGMWAGTSPPRIGNEGARRREWSSTSRVKSVLTVVGLC